MARRTALNWRLTPVAEAMSSLAASMKSRRLVRLHLDDDGDWWHEWDSDRVLVSEVPWSDPDAHVRHHHATFLAGYRPAPGDVVVDCGAGVGTELRLFSDLVGPRGRVVAIEPDPDASRRATKVANRLPLRNVTLVRCAVSDAEGDGVLDERGGEDSVASQLSTSPGATGVHVQVRRLDAILDELDVSHVDLLKVNIEGFELHALRGLGDRLRDVANLCVSCHDFVGAEALRTYDDVRAFLPAAGFTLRPRLDAPLTDAAAWYVFASRIAG